MQIRNISPYIILSLIIHIFILKVYVAHQDNRLKNPYSSHLVIKLANVYKKNVNVESTPQKKTQKKINIKKNIKTKKNLKTLSKSSSQKTKKVSQKYSKQMVYTFEKIRSQISHSPRPHYPLWAKRRGMQGTVVLKVIFNSLGMPISTQVLESSGYKLLDQSAIETLKKWRLHPSTNQNSYTKLALKRKVQFKLVD